MTRAIQEIHYRGQLAGIVTGESAIITAALTGRQLADVQAMCLYAISVTTAEPPRPYSDDDALAYAERAHANRLLRPSSRPTGR
jgi:hypothetical protein